MSLFPYVHGYDERALTFVGEISVEHVDLVAPLFLTTHTCPNAH
jgi:hypothetical protein